MTRIGKTSRAKFKKFKYGKGLDGLLSRTMKITQPQDNILAQIAVSMQAKIKYGEVNYYSNSITMDSDIRSIFIYSRCTACILYIAEDFFGELVDSTRFTKGFGGTIPPLIKKGTL